MRATGVTASLLILLASVACQSDPVRPEAGESFTLEPGEAVDLGVEKVRFTFTAVESDSRCPASVECPWVGDGAVRVTIDARGGPESSAVLHTTLEPQSLMVGGYLVRLETLAPYPQVPGEIDPRAYRATFRLEAEGG